MCVCAYVSVICICINAFCVYCTAVYEDINTRKAEGKAKDEHTYLRLFANWHLAFFPDMRYR